MRNQETGLDYANTDPSLHCNRIAKGPSTRWYGAWIYCLKNLDYEAAEMIHERNAPPSDQELDSLLEETGKRWVTTFSRQAVIEAASPA